MSFCVLRTILAAAAAAFVTVLFIFQVLALVAASLRILFDWRLAQTGQLEPLAPIAVTWGAPLFFLLVTTLLASWAGRKADGSYLAHGLAVGVLAAVGVQVIFAFRLPPVRPGEAAVYVLLGVVAGLLGAMHGHARQDRAEALYRANQALAMAKDPAGLVAALGESLRIVGVREVALWRISAGDSGGDSGPRSFEPWASWPPPGGGDFGRPGDVRLTPASAAPLLKPLTERRPAVLRLTDAYGDLVLANGAHDARSASRSRSRVAFLTPLLTNTGDWVGVLGVTSRRAGLASQFASPAARRVYLALASQAALALENIRLVDEARGRGEEKGELRERERLRGEVHDTVIQDIQAISINTEGLLEARLYDRNSDPGEMRLLRQVLRRARNASAEMRALLSGSRPEPLEESEDLSEALSELARRFSEETGCRTYAETTGAPAGLSSEVEDELFKAAREGLRNVDKHARASRAKLTLSYLDGLVVLDVADDGAGPEGGRPAPVVAANRGGDGLRLLRGRVERLGGTLGLHRQPGKGTTLTVRFPLERAEEQEARTA